MTTIRVTAEEGGARLDSLLASKIENMSRNAAQKLLEQGYVRLSGNLVKKNHKVAAGEVFEVELPAAKDSALQAEEIPLEVLFEDESVIVINKPKGMVVHPAPGHEGGTLVNALMAHCGDSLSGIGGEKRPGIVHRIDKDTSGLIIAAKNDAAHRKLAAQLKDRSLSRVYEAIVIGNIKDDSGTIDAPIGRDTKNRKRMAVTQKNSRSAVTHFEVVGRYRGYTHVRCRLETGRTHQIRVHLSYRGNPVLGDTLYGGRAEKRFALEGQCLHAKKLSFTHPVTGERLTLEAPLPQYFQDCLSRLSALGL